MNRLRRNSTFLQKTISVLLIMLLIYVNAYADSARDIQLNLPRMYSGIFYWLNNKGLQSVTIEIKSVEINKSGIIEARGKGVYQIPGNVTNIDIYIQIDPASLSFEMWEDNPDSDGFTTSGSHRGSIAQDLKTIKAKWIKKDTGHEGVLELFAKE